MINLDKKGHPLPGQGRALQLRISFAEPLQETPPCASSLKTVLFRDISPVPQLLEQVDQSQNLFHLQLTKYNNNNDKVHNSRFLRLNRYRLMAVYI